MAGMLITAGIISLIAAILGSLLALYIQRRALMRTQAEHQAWERAQESQQQMWMMRQTKRILELEQKLTAEIHQIHTDWQTWKSQDAARLEQLSQHFREASAQLNLEKDLLRLPRVEEMPVSINGQHDYATTVWQPPSFYRANLSGRDLSHRYLEQVDLREAQLIGTNFFMADLSGACLAGANLSGANLSGANLVGADLRNTILTDANLLVTDLQHAVLVGANLLGAHHLTTQQLYTAIYDSTTQLDPEVDLTPPRLPSVRPALTHNTSPQPIAPPTLEAEIVSVPSDSSPLSEKTEPVPTLEAETVSVIPEVSDVSIEPTGDTEAVNETPIQPQLDLPSLDGHPIELAPLLQPSSNGNQLDPVEADLQSDRQENIRTEEFDIAIPNARRNGKRRAKAN